MYQSFLRILTYKYQNVQINLCLSKFYFKKLFSQILKKSNPDFLRGTFKIPSILGDIVLIISSEFVTQFSHLWLFATPWIAARQASLSITNSWSPPKPMSIVLVVPSDHLILSHPLLLLPSVFPSIRVFSDESALHIRWPKYWSFSFNISPSSEHPGLVFRVNWLDLLAVQGTLKSLLQHHSSKAPILRHSAFFIVQLSHPYMTTGKIIALTRNGPLLAK